MADKQQAVNNLKLIKSEVEQSTGLGTDIQELNGKIGLEEDVISGIITSLIASGEVEQGKEFQTDTRIFTPKIKVKLSAQLRLL